MNSDIIIYLFGLLILYNIFSNKKSIDKFTVASMLSQTKYGDFGDLCDPSCDSILKCKVNSEIGASNQLPLTCAGDIGSYSCRVKPDFTNKQGPCVSWSGKGFNQLAFTTIPYCTPQT
jgi:hypothetical protein